MLAKVIYFIHMSLYFYDGRFFVLPPPPHYVYEKNAFFSLSFELEKMSKHSCKPRSFKGIKRSLWAQREIHKSICCSNTIALVVSINPP